MILNNSKNAHINNLRTFVRYFFQFLTLQKRKLRDVFFLIMSVLFVQGFANFVKLNFLFIMYTITELLQHA